MKNIFKKFVFAAFVLGLVAFSAPQANAQYSGSAEEAEKALCSSSSQPSIKVLSPNGGEVYQAGQPITIKWSTCNIPTNSVVNINTDWMQALGPNFNTTSVNDGVEVITMPINYVGQFKVIVTSYPYDTNDFSNNLFTVNGQTTIPIDSDSYLPPGSSFPPGCSSSSGFSQTTGLSCSGSTPMPPIDSDVTTACTLNASLSSATTSMQYISSNTSNFKFLTVNFTASGCDVKLTKLGGNVTGSISPSSVSNLTVWDGYGPMQLGTGNVYTNGSWSALFSNSLFIPNGTTKQVVLKANVNNGLSGQTVGLSVSAATAYNSNTGGLLGSISTVYGYKMIISGQSPEVGCTSSSQPSIKVLSPNGGEAYISGQPITIKWTTCNVPAGVPIGVVLIKGSTETGAWLQNPINSNNTAATVNDGVDSIIFPAGLPGYAYVPGNDFKVGLQAQWYAGTNYSNFVSITDKSDNFFKISSTPVTTYPPGCTSNSGFSSTTGQPCSGGTPCAPEINVLSPNGGEVYQDGQQITVKWKAECLPMTSGNNVRVALAYDIPSTGTMPNYTLSNTTLTPVNGTTQQATFTLPTIAFLQQLPISGSNSVTSGLHYKVNVGLFNANGNYVYGGGNPIVDFSNAKFIINGSSGTTYPPGCTSNSGFSSTTGQSCNVSVFPPGCSSSSGFSTTTGQSCSGSGTTTGSGCFSPLTGQPCSSPFPPGCTSNSGYSSTTGQPCSGSSFPPGCTSSSGFSSTTGQSCSGSSFPPGCTSSSGYSQTTGQSCSGTTTPVPPVVVYPAGCSSSSGFSSTTGQSCSGQAPLVCNSSSQPSIRVISPNGGQTFTAGQQITVKWVTCNAPVGSQVIIGVNDNSLNTDFSLLPMNHLPGFATNVTANDGEEIVTIPNDPMYNYTNFQYGSDFKLRMWLSVNPNQYQGITQDLSDNFFAINQ